MMLPTDAAITTRRSSLSGTLAALIGLPSYRARCVHQAWMFVRFRPAARPGIELRHNIPDFRFIRKHSETAGGNSDGPGGQVDAARDTPRPAGSPRSAPLLAGDPRLDRRLGDRRGHRRHDAGVEHRRGDVLVAQLALGHDG